MSEPSKPANSPQSRPRTTRPTPDQRAAFFTALNHGASARQAALAVGVNRNTGATWARQAKVRQAEQQARAVAIASKTELAQVYSKLALSEDVDPRDRVAAGKAHAELMGLNAPVKTQSLVVNIHADTEHWLLATESEDMKRLNAASSEPAEPIASKALPPKPSSEAT